MLVLLIDVLLVLALELKELLLGLEYLLFLDALRLEFRLLDNFILLSLKKYLTDKYVCAQGHYGS